MTSAAVRVDRLNAAYVVTKDATAPEQVRARYDAALQSGLTDACRRRLQGLTDGEAVWLIKRLDLEVGLGESLDDLEVAERFAAEIESALARTVRAGPDGDRVMVFPNLAEFLAWMTVDLAAGQLWRRWYAQRFEDLAWRPTGAAVVVLLGAHRDVIGLVLRTLRDAGRLDEVLRALTEQDCRDLLDAWIPSAPPSPDALLASARRLGGITPSPTGYSSFETVLRLLVQSGATLPDDPHLAGTRGAIEIVLFVADLVRRHGSAVVSPAADIASEMWRAGAALSEGLSQRAHEALGRGGEWIDTVIRSAEFAEARPDKPMGTRWATPYGGAFLLLESIVELESMIGNDSDGRSVLRLLLLAASFGHDERALAMGDPGLRTLAGIRNEDVDASAIPMEELEELGREYSAALREITSGSPTDVGGDIEISWDELAPDDRTFLAGKDPGPGERSTAAAARCVLSLFARRLLGFQRSSARHLVENFLAVDASVASEESGFKAALADPPLGLVLRMTGLSDAIVDVPWLEPSLVTIEVGVR